MMYCSSNERTVKGLEKSGLEIIAEHLPARISAPLRREFAVCGDKVTEVVLRTDRPLCLYEAHRTLFVAENGCLTDAYLSSGLLVITAKEMEEIVLRLCDYSVYAYQNEINSGFITINGGVRVGLCGKAVVKDGSITNIRDISSLSFRVARDVRNCAVPLLAMLHLPSGVLVCGVPGSGKTTLIRDMARQLSYSHRVSVLDERCELTAYSRNTGGFDIGLCDVYVGYPKGIAANQAIRAMVPELIVCDEIGDRTDVEMLMYSMRCGVSFIATVHASSMQDLRSRKITSELIETGAFRYIVFLKSDDVGRIDRIYEMCDTHD